MDEFKGMREKIDSLEKTLASKDKEIEVLKDKNITLQNTLEDISTMSLFERIFNWKSNVKNLLGND